jgi:2-oxoglutarate dehydrogenase E1 component
MLMPMLDELIERAAADGVGAILLGMAHRGRLNVLAHVIGKPYARILAEFEGRVPSPRAAASGSSDEGWAGDVKYHAGGRRAYAADDYQGGTVSVIMVPNPSHLEAVDPVVEGMARAAHDHRQQSGAPTQEPVAALPVLIHGDASFPGQGVVAETFNLSRLPGYGTGGTLHVIANNQLGFTTPAAEGRSTLYASDLAKGFEVPVIHVNADDAIACLATMRLAVAYRDQFHKDVLVDLVGYRRWGHNEGDEPSFTQPLMYQAIGAHPTVRESFAAGLVERGVVPSDEPDQLLKAGLDEFHRIRQSVRAFAASAESEGSQSDAGPHSRCGSFAEPRRAAVTALSLDRLRELNAALHAFPPDFRLHPKLERAVQRRRAAFDTSDARLDWGHAEALAFGTILQDGTPIRLSGQDSVRGTFSQRHLTFYDAGTGQAYTPLQRLAGINVSFDARNSPLSENAVLGFEYGYTLQAPETLLLWEAQYGDFVNAAQVVVDEFIVSGEAKWNLVSGLVLLLPHAWEGQGPDHSGGRLERFLQLAAEDNIVVANCSTAAQYFHLLRLQAAALCRRPKPLVLMTPKSLLRHPLAAAGPADLASAGFQPVLDDARAAARPGRVQRVVLCSGKVWTDLQGDRHRAGDALSVIRVERLYPFPTEEVRAALAAYDKAREVVWLQEEPQNMGAWAFVQPRLRDLLGGQAVRYVGRPPSASPAEGWAHVHQREQQRILDAVLEEHVSHAQ